MTDPMITPVRSRMQTLRECRLPNRIAVAIETHADSWHAVGLDPAASGKRAVAESDSQAVRALFVELRDKLAAVYRVRRKLVSEARANAGDEHYAAGLCWAVDLIDELVRGR